MKPEDYKSILAAIEKALKVCDESSGFMDAAHRKICEDLQDAKKRLVSLMGQRSSPQMGG